MRDSHIRRFVSEHPWAMLQSALLVVIDVFERRLLGEALSDEEIQARISQKKAERIAEETGAAMTQDGIALLPLHGVISHRMNMFSQISGGTSTEQFGHAFQALVDNPDVRAIMLDVDSPGGSVYGLDEVHEQMLAARGSKPIVAQISPLAASAAFWLASAADKIAIQPSGDAGSVGVFAIHQEYSEQEAKEGVRSTIIRAGKYKAEGNSHEPLTDDARKAMQARVDDAYDRFTGALGKSFGRSASTIKTTFGEGRLLNAREALKAGMVHEIATRSQSLARLSASLPGRSTLALSGAAATSQEPPLAATDQERQLSPARMRQQLINVFGL
jgi:signal peptide peptidase SppA